MIDAVLERLIALRNADGGWGATASRPSGTESTALSLMALSLAGRSERTGAAAWLIAHQRPDGAWPVTGTVPQASWATSLAVLALHDQPGTADSVRRGLDWITVAKGSGLGWKARLAEFFRREQTVELDPTLEGWSWTPGTFSWIEPTSWAIIALRAGFPVDAPRTVRRRIDEGRRMIIDRACPRGGWNFGNKIVLGVELEPYPDSTALALLALSGTEQYTSEVARGFAALDLLLLANHSGLTLSLSILCNRAWERDEAALRSQLERSFARTGFLDDVRSLALSVIATAEGPNPVLPGHG